MIRRPPRSTQSRSSAASDVYKRQVLNHVCMHQTVIGLEAKAQMEKLGEYPDTIIGCVGGGSNASGIAFPFMKDKFDGKDLTILAVEPVSCPTLTKGKYE